MARTTAIAVRNILLKDYDADAEPSLLPFMEAASSMVDDVVTCATRKGLTVSTAKQELLERWLSAHAYCVNDRQYTNRSTLGGGGSMGGPLGTGLESTSYGQFALALDTTGCLENIGKRQRARGYWLGKAPSEQTDYEDRD